MTDIYEQLQTEADVEAEKIRPTKEESSLYGAKWLTTEDLLTDDKGYPKFAVDSAKGGGGGIAYKAVFNPITEEIQPTSQGFYVIENYDADVVNDNNTFILEMNMNTPIYLTKTTSGGRILLADSDRKNTVIFQNNLAIISLDPTYGPYDYPSSNIFLYATYFQESEDEGE